MTSIGQRFILDLQDEDIEKIMTYLSGPDLWNLGKAIERVHCAERVTRNRQFRKYIILRNIKS